MTWPLNPGDVYLNRYKSIGRCVMTGSGMVVYFDFGWPDGTPFSVGRCQRGSFRKWAQHQASPLEIANMDNPLERVRVEIMQRQTEELNQSIRHYLGMASVEQLRLELSSRIDTYLEDAAADEAATIKRDAEILAMLTREQRSIDLE